MSGPPLVLQLGRSVLLSGQAVLDARALVAAGLRTVRGDGLGCPPRLRALLAALDAAAAAAAVSESGHADGHDTAEAAPCEVMDTADISRALSCSRRTAQRIAAGIGTRAPGGAWMVDRRALDAHIYRRRNHP